MQLRSQGGATPLPIGAVAGVAPKVSEAAATAAAANRYRRDIRYPPWLPRMVPHRGSRLPPSALWTCRGRRLITAWAYTQCDPSCCGAAPTTGPENVASQRVSLACGGELWGAFAKSPRL